MILELSKYLCCSLNFHIFLYATRSLRINKNKGFLLAFETLYFWHYTICSRDEKKSQAIKRLNQEMKRYNKNYKKEGKKVLALSWDEKVLFENFLKLKALMGMKHSKARKESTRDTCSIP